MSFSLPARPSSTQAPPPPRAARDGWMAGLMVVALLRAGEILAGDLPAQTVADWKPDLYPAPPIDGRPTLGPVLPGSYHALDLSVDSLPTSATFRPRGRSILEKDDPLDTPVGAPLIRSTTVWQRLSEYRAHDRLRVLTLWETGGNSVSLQAGRRGDPSLQWTSRLMGREGGSHGILDTMFSKSLGAMLGRSLRGSSRPAGGDGGAHPDRVPEAGKIP